MKKLLGLTLLVAYMAFIAFSAPAFSQKAPEQSALEKMVATERAFAKLSLDQGTREAFMAYIADDGILFRPTAVKGKQWMKDHPVPPSDKRPLLSWYPAVAGIAQAGDMGYTTGPWEFKSDIHDAAPIAWGHFLTVWKKQADGSWKFAVDIGISHPQPSPAGAPWELPKNYKAPGRMKGVWSFSSDALLARDREFAKDSAARGSRAAFASYAAGDVRVYREEKFPLVGQEPASAVLPASPSVWTWEPEFADVSVSNDLGFTYGAYKIETDAKTVETGNYLRIWQKDGGAWKVIFDLTNPIPPEKKE